VTSGRGIRSPAHWLGSLCKQARTKMMNVIDADLCE
jgi:hypothetical protein